MFAILMIVPLIAVTPTVSDQPLNPPSPSARKSQQHHQGSATNEHQQGDGTGKPPDNPSPVVPNNQSPNQNPVASKPKDQSGWYADPNWWVAVFTGLLFIATAGLWVFTALLWLATRKAVRDAKESSKVASAAADAATAHVRESARAAIAMEGVSTAMAQNVIHMGELMDMQREFWRKQMRAYVGVRVGEAFYQERDKNVRFEVRPLLINSGHTPAHDVAYDIRCDVLPIPISNGHDFHLQPQNSVAGPVVGPQQPAIMTAFVDRFYPDEEVERIKAGRDKALCVWGTVRYKDAFGLSHFTNFCQVINWTRGGHVIGHYHKDHNESDQA